MGKKKYLTAKEAYEIATNVSHMDDVMEQIRNACKNGYYRTSFNELTPLDASRLEAFGYKVSEIGPFIEVVWYTPNDSLTHKNRQQ